MVIFDTMIRIAFEVVQRSVNAFSERIDRSVTLPNLKRPDVTLKTFNSTADPRDPHSEDFSDSRGNHSLFE